MGAPPRSAPIETGPPPFALPWPIYPRTIFPGSGELASKRGAGRGGSNFDGQIAGQIIRFQKKRPSRKKSGKVKSLPRFGFESHFQNPVSEISSEKKRQAPRSAF